MYNDLINIALSTEIDLLGPRKVLLHRQNHIKIQTEELLTVRTDYGQVPTCTMGQDRLGKHSQQENLLGFALKKIRHHVEVQWVLPRSR